MGGYLGKAGKGDAAKGEGRLRGQGVVRGAGMGGSRMEREGEAEIRDALDVLGVWEHIDRDNIDQLVDRIEAEGVQVAGEGSGLAGDVEDLGGLIMAERLDGVWVATASWGIEDDGSESGVKALEDGWETVFDGAGDDFAVGAVFGGGVGACGEDGLAVMFDAGEGDDAVGEFDGEEADAAIGVDEELDAAIGETLCDGLDESWEQVKIVLKEGIGWDVPTFGWETQGDFDAAAGGRVGADGEELAVESGFGDGAGVDIDDEAIIVSEEADDEALFGFVPLGSDHDAIAVMVGLGAGNDGLDGGIGETADALEEFADLLVFELELGGVIEVLVLAAAAVSEVGAAGGDAVGCGLEDAEEMGAGEAFFNFGDFDFDDFAGDDEGDEDDEVIVTCDAFAAEGEVSDGE
jgi:hypothetical protein